MQTVWKGSISFGLVSIPVRLFSATEEKDIGFRQVHAKDGGRVKYKRFCSIDGEEVPYSDIAKGYEVGEEMVVLYDEDFANLPVPTIKAVEVLSFVPAEQIDPLLLDKPYYAEPTGDPKPYVLLRDTLIATEKVAIVKVALRQRERLATIRAQGEVLVMQTLLWPDEIRVPLFEFFTADVAVRPQEVAMAKSYVEALSEDFDPGQFRDNYRDALTELVEAKIAGREMVQASAPAESGKLLDLMAALQASVAAAKEKHQPEAKTGG